MNSPLEMFSNDKSVVRFEDQNKKKKKPVVKQKTKADDPLFRDHVEEPVLSYQHDYQINFPDYNQNMTKKLVS